MFERLDKKGSGVITLNQLLNELFKEWDETDKLTEEDIITIDQSKLLQLTDLMQTVEPTTPPVTTSKKLSKSNATFQYTPLLEIVETSSVQTAVKSARMHLCHYLIAVVEAVESFIEEDLPIAISKKVLTGDATSGSPSNKQSKLLMPQLDLENF